MPTTSTGQLRHITEEHDVEHIESGVQDQVDIDFDMSGNDTNKEALLYFDRISKHYLCLVKGSSVPSYTSRHDRSFPVIADSGANYHMIKRQEFLYHPYSSIWECNSRRWHYFCPYSRCGYSYV
jgi:hypothetical protein